MSNSRIHRIDVPGHRSDRFDHPTIRSERFDHRTDSIHQCYRGSFRSLRSYRSIRSISGAHFNPAVTIAMLVAKEIDRAKAGMYIAVQLAGGIVGLLVTDLMFYGTASTFYTNTSQLLIISSNVKGLSLVFSEFICTVHPGRSDLWLCKEPFQIHIASGRNACRWYANYLFKYDVREPNGHSKQDVHLCYLRYCSSQWSNVHHC